MAPTILRNVFAIRSFLLNPVNMQERVNRAIIRKFLFLFVALVYSCDTFEGNDVIKPTLEQTQYHTFPGSSLIIDITSFTKQSLSISIDITSKPTRGTLTQVDLLLLKYRPSFDFKEGEDQFVITASHNGEIIARQTVTIQMKGKDHEFINHQRQTQGIS